MVIKQKYVKWLFWTSAVAVLIISSMPGASISYSNVHNLDKIVHFVAFFFLTMLLLMAYKFDKPFITTACIMALFGLAIELLQRYVPNRVFSMVDFSADILGIVLALTMFRIFSRKIVTA